MKKTRDATNLTDDERYEKLRCRMFDMTEEWAKEVESLKAFLEEPACRNRDYYKGKKKAFCWAIAGIRYALNH